MEMIVEFHRMNIFVEKILMSSVGPSWAGPGSSIMRLGRVGLSKTQPGTGRVGHQKVARFRGLVYRITWGGRIIRCRQFKLQVKFFFCYFFTSFDRAWAADHEHLFFSVSKCFFPVEKYDKLQGCHYSRKTQLFQNMQIFLLNSCCKPLKIFFSNSVTKTDYRQAVKSTLTPKIFSSWCSETGRIQ